MCNPSLVTGIFKPSKMLGWLGMGSDKPAPARPDPAAERASAEAEAAATANIKLATDKRRRRGQESLLARGAPQPTFGAAPAPMSQFAARGSLLSRGNSEMSTGA